MNKSGFARGTQAPPEGYFKLAPEEYLLFYQFLQNNGQCHSFGAEPLDENDQGEEMLVELQELYQERKDMKMGAKLGSKELVRNRTNEEIVIEECSDEENEEDEEDWVLVQGSTLEVFHSPTNAWIVCALFYIISTWLRKRYFFHYCRKLLTE